MTTPDTKGTQPEQLAYREHLLKTAPREELADEVRRLATALSECREREQRIKQYLTAHDAAGETINPVDLWHILAAQPPSEAACTVCGAEMEEVTTSVTGVCPTHGVRPAQPPSEASERSGSV